MEKQKSGINKLLVVTNILAIAAAVYFFYQSNNESKPDPIQPGVCREYPDLEGEPWDHFKSAVNNYYTNIYPEINAKVNQLRNGRNNPDRFVDARAIWFSMDSLKQFIYTIEKYSTLMNLSTSQLGIRFYYGQYSADHQAYADHHTLFLVPTYANNATETAIDFDPRYNYTNLEVRDVKSIRSLRAVAEGNPSTTVYSILGASEVTNPSIRNSGELCPPKCITDGNNTFLLTDH
ncbi:MAG: hypothetical protein NTW29_04310 [Bacteroidetes bacterium]|nr:hypothetical protein [Bacteroidota bacterium]